MKKEQFFKELGKLDDDLIDRAETAKKAKPQPLLIRIAAAAACLALLLAAFMLFPTMTEGEPPSVGDPAGTTEGTEKPPVLPPNDRVQINDSRFPVTFGNVQGTLAPSSSAQSSISGDGLAVSVKPLQLLEDTYYFYDDQRKSEFRLLLVETQSLLRGSHVVDYFYVQVSPEYAVDFTEYDTLVFLDLWQRGYEGNLVCNVTDNCLEILDYCVLAHSFAFYCEDTIAFSDGVFDESLWTVNDAWAEDTEYVRNNLDELSNRIYVGRGWTLEQTETKIREHAKNYSSHNAFSLYDLESEEAQQAWEYVKNTENGLFVLSSADITFRAEIRAYYTRYIDGFETNERYVIYSDRASHSTAVFTAEDIEKMPDLYSAIHAVNENVESGHIAPPHISKETVASADRVNTGVFGWYVKCTDGKVYGVIRVSYKVRAQNYQNFYDDAYYLVEYGAQTCEPIERDELMARLGMKKPQINTVYEIYRNNIYVGEYNENGMDLSRLAIA